MRRTSLSKRGLPVVGATGLLMLAAACATVTPDDAGPRVLALAPEVRDYLVDPTVGMEDVPGGSRSRAFGVFEQLRVGDIAGARQGLGALDGVGGEVQRVLEAQLAFAESRPEEARQILGRNPSGDAGLLLSARLHDLAGEPAAAVADYLGLRGRLAVADERVAALLPDAIEQRDHDFDRALANRDIDRARVVLEDLRNWSADREQTRRSSVRLARATGDEAAELAAWRSLARVAPPSREEMFQWAELELTDGNPDQALEVSRALVASADDDPEAQELLARAEFTWRSRLLPEKARAVLKSPVLSRAELAVALYWLFPQARYAPSQAVRIASDILENPYREEIAQVVNAGLLDVDPVGHRFRPDAPAMRSEAVRCVAELLRVGGARCAVGTATSDACAVLGGCGIVAVDRCKVGEAVSGAEFSDWARRAQERLTRP